MDKTEALENARIYASVIMKKYDCKSIYLFGSHARGTNQENSDIDIAIVLDEFENPLDIQLDLMRLRRQIDSRIEPHPFRKKDFTELNPLAYEILTHGQKINVS